jgi:predicted transcriptional regulator
MSSHTPTHHHIEITEMLVRLYVFLTQYLDRCLDEAARKAYPDEELHVHLSTTREAMADILAVNPVVKSKVEKECKDVLALGAAILKGGHERASAMEPMRAQRAILKNKTIALSDLLGVFRAL